MNPTRRDRWPAYRPTRHVLVARSGRHARPWQGFVVDWRRKRADWQALVVYQDETIEGAPLVWRWIPAGTLRPVFPDPNRHDDGWY